MKHKLMYGLLAILVLFLVIWTGCDKVEDPSIHTKPPKQTFTYWGEAYANVNGVLWKANPLNSIKGEPGDDKCLTFSIARFDSVFNIARERIGFGFFGCEAGETYPLVSRHPDSNHYMPPEVTVKFWVLEGGDAILDSYNILEGPQSYITIISFDPATEEIIATFEGTFVIDSLAHAMAPPYNRWLPDTLIFENGHIHSKHVE